MARDHRLGRSKPNEGGLRSLGDKVSKETPGSGAANQDRLHSLGAAVDRHHRERKPRNRTKGRHRKLKLTLLTLGIVGLLVVGSGAGYAWYLNSEVHRIDVKGLSPGVTQGKDAGTQNILMVGSTTRCGLKTQTAAYGLCTQGVTGVNSDVIMILHLNPAVPSVSILSIPRDLFIPNARSTGAWKIDAGLVQGPTQLVAAIEEDFGIPIQHYVELNFDTFAGVVNAIGGITMEFPEPVFDAESGLNVPGAGCRHMTGVQALQVVRARHLQYKSPTTTSTTHSVWPQEAQSDLARIRRDHEFLRVLASTVVQRGITNPITDEKLVSSVVSDLTVDSSFSASDMVTMLLSYHAVSVSKSPQLTLPVAADNFGSYVYQGRTFGDVEFPPQPLEQSVINQFLGVTNNTETMVGGSLPSPSAVTVNVLNGTGAANQATTTGDALSKLGFKIATLGTSAPVGHESETTVGYASRTGSDVADAELVARSLSGAVIMAYTPKLTGADVTVTTGSDFTVNTALPSATPATHAPPVSKKKAVATTTAAPATAAPATSGTSSSTASTSTTAPASQVNGLTSNFTVPSSATEPLAPWDPRACPPPPTKK